ncbi:MAG: hypothetical protein Q8S14_20615 [Algoriphagus sp.]|uniref:hypothetical protein n=1 Tax=Algoriphagus sp. TaxID=1872435 RepID=UPI002731A149|nr:hypothetical protein [Algoriphagus sp.]MDP2043240.1 hypothetical protein [Algoriphagus sp.]MDP3474283.1 hypothetical protein [Algoriphagus sp.]
MKKLTLLFFSIIFSFGVVKGQESVWETPMHEVRFTSEGVEGATLKVDPGFRYADLRQNERHFRIFFNNNNGVIKNARIIDQDSKLQVARGRGSYFWGTARFEFIDGEVFKVKLKRNRNGYDVIGPYEPLFIVENFGIKPVKTLNEKDFLAQAFYVFDRIKSSQKPPSEVIILTSRIATIQ